LADRFSDPGWWPTPPPKPLKAPSAAKLVFGTILPGLAVVGAVVALSTIGHSSHKAKPEAAAPAATSVGATEQSRRQAFAECMKSMDAGPSFRGGGRFGGGGPSKRFRTAFEVCRSLLSPGSRAPVAPAQPTRTTAVPVA
jgi:hypothetical protein